MSEEIEGLRHRFGDRLERTLRGELVCGGACRRLCMIIRLGVPVVALCNPHVCSHYQQECSAQHRQCGHKQEAAQQCQTALILYSSPRHDRSLNPYGIFEGDQVPQVYGVALLG